MKKIQLILVLAIFSALLLSACGGAAESAAPTETPTSVPADSGGAGPSSLDLSDSDQIQEIPGNYEIEMDFVFDGFDGDGNQLSGSILMDGAQLGDGSATEMIMSASGAANFDGVDYIEFTEIDGQLYFYNEITGCISLPDDDDEDTLFNNLVDVGGFISGEVQRILPNETINGVPSYHFEITQANLDTSDPESMDVDQITDGSLYIAQDGGYVVRMMIEGTGESELLTGISGRDGMVSYQLDFIPVSGVLDIQPPEACGGSDSSEESANSEEYPVLSDAENVASFGSLFSYSTASSIDDAVDFYKAELDYLGWTLDQEIAAGETAILSFTQGSEALSVAFNADPNNPGSVSIVIVKE
jgi:hypothetical protein